MVHTAITIMIDTALHTHAAGYQSDKNKNNQQCLTSTVLAASRALLCPIHYTQYSFAVRLGYQGWS